MLETLLLKACYLPGRLLYNARKSLKARPVEAVIALILTMPDVIENGSILK